MELTDKQVKTLLETIKFSGADSFNVSMRSSGDIALNCYAQTNTWTNNVWASKISPEGQYV